MKSNITGGGVNISAITPPPPPSSPQESNTHFAAINSFVDNLVMLLAQNYFEKYKILTV